MDERLREAIEACEYCISVIKNHRIAEEDNAIWSVGTSSKPRITEKILRTLIEAATERDTLAKALEVAVRALQEVGKQSGKYIGCRCPSEENGGMGDCWPCRMIMIGFIPQEALSEIERIKGEK
jgi:hypothetical protein